MLDDDGDIGDDADDDDDDADDDGDDVDGDVSPAPRAKVSAQLS